MSQGFLLLLVLGALAAVIYLLVRKKSQPLSEAVLYQKLLRKTRGDQAQAERLIALERSYHPTYNRRTLIQYAIKRWERENH